jgi:parallel beta-helix repeat protein
MTMSIMINVQAQAPPKAATVHGIMEFDGDGDAGWAEFSPGSEDGSTWALAYVIENLEIDALNSRNPIKIENSQNYVIIQHCTLFNGGSVFGAGIYIINCTNIRIINCTIYGSENGVSILNGTNIEISGCKFYSNIRDGIYIKDSNNIILKNNVIANNTRNGLYLGNLDYSNVTGNTISGNGLIGHCFFGPSDTSSHNRITSNVMKSNTGGSATAGYLNNSWSGNYFSDYQAVVKEYNSVDGIHYIHPFPIASGETDSFALIGDDSLAMADIFEDNDLNTTAKDVNATTYNNLVSFDKDYYKIALKEGDSITVSITFLNVTADIGLFLYKDTASSTSDFIASSNSKTDDETMVFVIKTAGVYIINVNQSNPFGYTFNRYNMTITVVPAEVEVPGYDVSIFIGSMMFGMLAIILIIKKRS